MNLHDLHSNTTSHPVCGMILVIFFVYFLVAMLAVALLQTLLFVGYVTIILLVVWTLFSVYYTDKAGRESGFVDLEDMLGTFLTVSCLGPLALPFIVKGVMNEALDRLEPDETPPAPARYRREEDKKED